MKKLLLKSMLLLCALIVGSGTMCGATVTKQETFNFSTTGCSGWTSDHATSYCGGYGYKSGDFYVVNSSISNISNVDFSSVTSPSITITVKALTNNGTNSYTVSLVNSSGTVVGTPVTKTGGMGTGTNASSASESTVTLTPVKGATGYRIDFKTKASITQTKYTLTYDPAPAAPTFSPAAGEFSDDFVLTISCATDGATIYYTTNGDTPTSSSTVYDPANKPTITAGADVTVKAIAIKADVSSTVSSATYTYKNIANPVFGTTDGSTVLYGESVAITCATDGADIYYTQGSTPADPTSSSTKYTGPIVLTAGTTIKAIAINGSDESEVVSATYIVKATAPTFSLDEGTYNTTKSVMLSCTTDDATIYYTTDGTTPTNESTVYSSAIAVNVSTTINAIAIKSGLTNSDVTSAEYTLKVATPSFSISGGDFDDAQNVELFCTTEGATIHYTTNGATPTSSSSEYTAAITISDVKTLKAIAIKDGWTNSDVASEEYRVVVPADLPFEYDGDATSNLPSGLIAFGLTDKYKNSPKIKFDNTGDYLILKFAETPGKLSYTLKGNGMSGDYKFSVLESANGTDYSVLQEYTSIDATAFTETFTPASTTRYIKWIYTIKVNGNVALGKINLDLPGPANPTTSGEETYLTTSDNMAGWRAFYHASKNYSVDANTKVYVADADPVGTTITLTAIEGIPAGEAVILHTSSSADNYKMTLTEKPENTYSYDGTNKLLWKTTAVSNVYRLGYGASGVGFYPYSGTPASGAVILNVDSSTAGARELTIDIDDDVTGISTMHNSQSIMHNEFYNLAGQRVAQPTKGLYIVNGRKVIIK